MTGLCRGGSSSNKSSATTPSLHVDYKHTTINDTRDIDIGKRLVNLPALREIGFKANQRLLSIQRLDHDPITGTRDLHALNDPSRHREGTRIPGFASDNSAAMPCCPRC